MVERLGKASIARSEWPSQTSIAIGKPAQKIVPPWGAEMVFPSQEGGGFPTVCQGAESCTIMACILLVLVVVASATADLQTVQRPPKQQSYEFWFHLEERLTMTNHDQSPAQLIYYNVTTKQFKVRDMEQDTPCNAFIKPNTTPKQPGSMIPADGLHKPVITINGSTPGPTIVVYEGSDIILHVTNGLLKEAISIHFHGLHMTNNFWNDGASKVSQFPLIPGQTFTHKFKAESAGTFLYHGHSVTDRGDGLYGALVILKDEAEEPKEQFVMDITDWFPGDALSAILRDKWKFQKTPRSYEDFQQCYAETQTFDGSVVSPWMFGSILINGKGWHDLTQINDQAQNLPLETFVVGKDKEYKFRVINSGMVFPFLISIDNHTMEVMATDGVPIKKVEGVDYFIIYSGERFDFILQTKQNPHKDVYYIQVRTLETLGLKPLWSPAHATVGFLSYTNENARPNEKPTFGPSEMDDPTSRCTSLHKCKVLNCPFPKLGKLPYLDCITVNQLELSRDPEDRDTLKPSYTSKFEEHFVDISVDVSLNGYSFEYPKAPPGLLKTNPENFLYDCKHCSTVECKCTQVLDLTIGNTVQVVFANLIKVDGYTHPMHLHGHHFYVTKLAFPEYEPDGKMKKINSDITCNPNKLNSCRWTNSSWRNGEIPGMNLENPVLKDTVPVPMGGYAVVRFHAGNPGWWPLHCHIMPHHLNGMALLIHEGTYEEQPENKNAIVFGEGEAKCLYEAVHKASSPQLPNPSFMLFVSCFCILSISHIF